MIQSLKDLLGGALKIMVERSLVRIRDKNGSCVQIIVDLELNVDTREEQLCVEIQMMVPFSLDYAIITILITK